MRLGRFLIASVLWLGLAASAAAHDPRPVAIDLAESGNGQWTLAWHVPEGAGAAGVSLALGPDCTLPSAPASLTGQLQASCTQPPRELTVAFSPRSPAAAILLRVAYKSGQFHTASFPDGTKLLPIPAAESVTSTFAAYLRLGVEHIAFGWDHLLFVLCLTALAGSFSRIALAVTGFTLGHSLTLSLAALGVVSVRIQPVEALIAASIVLLAYELARPEARSLTHRAPAVISAAFGLIHGLGFASALKEIGLPQTQLVPALVAFNLGVEVGQLSIVVAAIGISAAAVTWWPLRRAVLNQALAYGAGTLATFWTIQRVAGIFA